jgi:hypothetical protein
VNEYRLEAYATLLFGASSDGSRSCGMRRIWGDLLPRRGYRILAQGFNPGNRPPGRRALKGRHKNSEEHIYIELAIAQRGAGTLSISQREIVSLPNKYPFLFGSIRSAFGPGDLALSGRTALIECFPGLKP